MPSLVPLLSNRKALSSLLLDLSRPSPTRLLGRSPTEMGQASTAIPGRRMMAVLRLSGPAPRPLSSCECLLSRSPQHLMPRGCDPSGRNVLVAVVAAAAASGCRFLGSHAASASRHYTWCTSSRPPTWRTALIEPRSTVSRTGPCALTRCGRVAPVESAGLLGCSRGRSARRTSRQPVVSYHRQPCTPPCSDSAGHPRPRSQCRIRLEQGWYGTGYP